MQEFETLTAGQFFIIDSEHLDTVRDRLYGFIIEDGKIIQEQDIKIDTDIVSRGGTFIRIKVRNNFLKITQDIDGSYGLYLFRRGDYFALSNSFLKLAEYVAERFPVTLNTDYAAALISLDLNSKSYSQTLLNEISMLPRNSYVKIDKKKKTLEVCETEVRENTIMLESDVAFSVMDEWYDRWTKLVRNVKRRTDHISIDLTGGFDSRVAFMIALGANIDLNRIRIYSNNDHLHTHTEDYAIASSIADYYGFELNKNLDNPYFFYKEPRTPMLISWYIKGGFHKQMYWKLNYARQPMFVVGGAGGEVINGHCPFGISDGTTFIKNQTQRAASFSAAFRNPVRKVLQDLVTHACQTYKVGESYPYLTLLLYRETNSRNHFGKNNVEDLFGNIFSLQPLMDPKLRQLKIFSDHCKDPKLLMAILLSRYCPKLLEFPYEGGRNIAEETIQYAKNLNRQHPFHKRELPKITAPDMELHTKGFFHVPLPDEKSTSLKNQDVEEKMVQAFCSPLFKNLFYSYFPREVYGKIYKEFPTRKFFPLQEVYTALISIQMAELAHYSQMHLHENDVAGFFDRMLQYPAILGKEMPDSFYYEVLKYATARLDVKNFGDRENKLEVLQSNCSYSVPKWFSNDKGEGIVFQSFSGRLHIKLKVVKNGMLTINLRGLDIRDKEGKRFPVWIDYTKLQCNGKNILSQNCLVCHDAPFTYKQQVQDGESIELEATWHPFSSQSEWGKNEKNLLAQQNQNLSAKNIFLQNQCQKFAAETDTIKKQIAEYQRNLARIQDDFDQMQYSVSFRVGRKLTYLPRKIRDWLR